MARRLLSRLSGRFESPRAGRNEYEVQTRSLPRWAAELIVSGEAVACLSLAGNHAVKLEPEDVGTAVSYRVRSMRDGELTPVAGPFEYDVVDVFGGTKGKAVAFVPRHAQGDLYLAFRGVRTEADGGAVAQDGPRTVVRRPSLDAGPSLDRANFIRLELEEPVWLSGSALQVHAGVLDHHDSFWESRPGMARTRRQKGMSEWVADTLSRRPHRRVIFLGLSFGGSLAQLTAYRVARLYPSLLPRLHVLAFGSVQWASPPMARHFAHMFKERVVNLVTLYAATGAGPTPNPGWWVLREAGEAPLVVDPVTANVSKEFMPLHNMFAMAVAGTPPPAPQHCDSDLLEGTQPAEAPLPLLPPSVAQEAAQDPAPPPAAPLKSSSRGVGEAVEGATIDRSVLIDWMLGRLKPTDQFNVDYMRLHVGRQYREALIRLLMMAQAAEQAEDEGGTEDGARPLPAIDVLAITSESPADSRGGSFRRPKSRNSSRDRNFGELLGFPGAGGSADPDESPGCRRKSDSVMATTVARLKDALT